ncbi:MAG: Gfo/Idh/MocA family oxidoreductase [Chloroflexi bacterium]|nr:Gfo/Idh/MocA family oxidoreductase [Chloroflexota bacterium]
MSVRIGLLGAARIAPKALIQPARSLSEVEVVAVAARDPARAHAFARRYGIPRVHPDYAALLADPTIEAVYLPLPNSLHAEWAARALQAGKHVLGEKPLAANAREAEQLATLAAASGRVLLEGFAYRYHPLAERLEALLASGTLGQVRRYEAVFQAFILRPGDIRWRLELAGGSLMDTGCYPVSFVRWLAGAEPEVVAARARLAAPQVDRTIWAELRFADGRTARVRGALRSWSGPQSAARVVGTAGELRVLNPFHPSRPGYLLIVRSQRGRAWEVGRGEDVYRCQLRAFAAAIRGEGVVRTGPVEAVANLRLIDAIYRAAGLAPRGQLT